MMEVKYISKAQLSRLKRKINKIRSYPTWTNEKHKARDSFCTYVDKKHKPEVFYSNSFIMNDDDNYSVWDYELNLIPHNQRGALKKYRGERVFIVSTYRQKWKVRKLLAFPLEP